MLELDENKSQVHVNKEGSMPRRSIWGEAQRGADARWKDLCEFKILLKILLNQILF